ncbi:MAG: GerMN domain-containing protein [Deltaproteobacteria bacterium]|nr:GerMN domain-containing protein [Deltaproteobacteria bacterium]MBW2171193.1 GerMN domain-containing protein [Deltaproteobacteria bacterium]
MKTKPYQLLTIVIICIIAGGVLALGYTALFSTAVKEGTESRSGGFLPNLAKVKAHLYFANKDGQSLKAEERSLVRHDNAVEHARSIVDALIEGPRSGLLPTLPAETSVLSLYVTEDGIAFVDFDRIIREKHPGGTLSELFTVFSVVNSISLNVPEVEATKILIEGREVKTLAGHIDIRFPLRPDILMIK